MYLKELIEILEKSDPLKVLPRGFNNPHSYRGYYDQLAFEPAENVTIGSMLSCAKGAVGQTFEGWKGGRYTMGEWTEVHIAERGECGEAIGPMLMGYMLDSANKQSDSDYIVERVAELLRSEIKNGFRQLSKGDAL